METDATEYIDLGDGRRSPLTKQELLALKKIVVRNNRTVVGVSYSGTYRGAGGTNLSPCEPLCSGEVLLKDIEGGDVYAWCGYEIVAAIDDVVYLRSGNSISILAPKRWISFRESIAYDTYGYFELSVLCTSD